MINSQLTIDTVLAQVKHLPHDWHGAGTVTSTVLEALVHHASQQPIYHSLETGSGRTTILLSHLSRNHKVFAVDAGNSIHHVRTSELFNAATVEFVEGPTQKTLLSYSFEHKLQLALIDGPHGYPFPDLEYYFIYPQIEEGGLLIVDDIQIPTIYNLFAFLKEDEMFELVDVVDQTAFFRRTAAELFSPVGDGWWLQKYNTNRLEEMADTCSLEQVRSQLHLTQLQLQQTKAELERSQAEVEAMRTSKFWKIREQWFRFKRATGLPVVE